MIDKLTNVILLITPLPSHFITAFELKESISQTAPRESVTTRTCSNCWRFVFNLVLDEAKNVGEHCLLWLFQGLSTYNSREIFTNVTSERMKYIQYIS